MTGFARAEGAADGLTWVWELRSVNGRGLDLRFRLPPGWDALEPPLREAAGKALKRGNVTANLSVKREKRVTPGGRYRRRLSRRWRSRWICTDAFQAARCRAPRRCSGCRALCGRHRPTKRPIPTRCRGRLLRTRLAALAAARQAEGARLGRDAHAACWTRSPRLHRQAALPKQPISPRRSAPG